jgi:hypothetical protein
MTKFYSIRVIKAESEDEALEKIYMEEFDECDPLCDSILTLEELKKELNNL